MPQKNTIKDFEPESFYHVYARGSNKQQIFMEPSDFNHFLILLARYLSSNTAISRTDGPYPSFKGKVELLAYCLMGNHFHLLLYQKGSYDLKNMMHALMTSYCRYFNLRHSRSGAVFESRYKAKLITDQAYLYHISRYIHLNPRTWSTYRYSSLHYYLGKHPPEWLCPNRITEMFSGPEEYNLFVSDYEEVKLMFDDLKHHLADQ